MSQNTPERRFTFVDAPSEGIVGVTFDDARSDLETVFHAQYARIARVISGVIKDHARAEELAVEVFLKWSRTSGSQGENAQGWLYRTAVRAALDELRRRTRRSRYEGLFGALTSRRRGSQPDELFAAGEEQERVRVVLSLMEPRQGELLVLRSHDFTYEELAAALQLNPASVGTLLSRAQQSFRKEYVKRYGEQ